MSAGRALGSRYTLVERLGQGASGEVWRALDRHTGASVAAKLLWPQHGADPEILTRFVNERAVLLGLDHPHIVRVHDFVVEGQDLAIVMDLVEGPSVATLLTRQRTLPAALAVPLAAAVLDALDSAHRHGVIHRDVKPDNILLARSGAPAPEDVRLADFGIAGIVQDEAAPVTELIGTPAYMPPELVSYGKFGPVSDVYAVGVVLYEMLSGRTPFAGPGTQVTVAMRQVGAAPPRLPVDDALWRIIDLMLAKDPAQRSSASSTAGLLRRLPATARTEESLPPQPAPETWADSVCVLPPKPEVERALGGVAAQERREDPVTGAEATSLRPARPMGRPAPAPAPAPDDSGATMRKAVRPRAPAPVRSSGRSIRTRVLIGVGTAVGVAAAGLALWSTGVFAPRTAEAEPVEITTAPAHLSGTALPTGLRTDLDAVYDATGGVTTLTVTVSAAPQAPLRGDLLLVVPGFGGAGCAEVAEQEGVVTRVKASVDGLALDCAYRLAEVAVDAGREVRIDLAVELDLVDDEGAVAPDYREWLSAVQQATDAGLSTVTGSAFPLQRVGGLRVEPADVTLAAAATPVPYRVLATWVSGAEPTELFTQDTTDGMEVELLSALTGGRGLDGVGVSSCHAAQVIGIRVLAEQPEASCALTVTVGALDSGETTFGIRMR